MDKEKFNERVKRLQEVDEIIKSLDPTIREASFKLLRSYVTGEKVIEEKGEEKADIKIFSPEKEEFFTKLNLEKPGDNVFSIAAYHYSQYGVAPISTEEIKEIANDVGITISSRPDMTLKNAKRENRILFNSAGKGKYKPTVHGEKYFKDTYQVPKGTKKKEKDET